VVEVCSYRFKLVAHTSSHFPDENAVVYMSSASSSGRKIGPDCTSPVESSGIDVAYKHNSSMWVGVRRTDMGISVKIKSTLARLGLFETPYRVDCN
jgi:hypothetical protein